MTIDEYKKTAAAMAPVTVVNGNQTGTGYVPTSTFLGGENGGYWDQQRGAAKDMYQRAVANNIAAAQSAIDFAQKQAEAQRTEINQGYANTNKQLYRDYMANQKALPQQLKAQGYTGGLSESSRLKLMNAYGENLAGNDQARMGDLAKIGTQLDQTTYEANAAKAAANASAQQDYAKALMSAREGEYAEVQQRADTMAAQGDFSGYLNLGYTQDQVDYMTKLWLQQNPAFLNAWVDAHPDEAARLGVKKKSTSSSRGSYTPTDDRDKKTPGGPKKPIQTDSPKTGKTGK